MKPIEVSGVGCTMRDHKFEYRAVSKDKHEPLTTIGDWTFAFNKALESDGLIEEFHNGEHLQYSSPEPFTTEGDE